MLSVFKTLYMIVTFRAGPEDLPYSKGLMVLLGLVELSMGVMTSHFVVQVVASKTGSKSSLEALATTDFMLIGLVKILLLGICVYGLLSYYSRIERFVQACSAMLGINIILSIFFMASVALLQLSGLALILFFILLYWNFMIITNIFIKSFDTEVLKAGLFALLYLLLQHNVSDMIFQNLIK